MIVVLTLILSIIIAIADQVLKFFVVERLQPIGNFSLIDNFLKLTYVENRGAAFGIFQNQYWFFIVSTVFIIIIAIYLLYKYSKNKLLCVSIAFIIGGGLGNLIDRIFRGYVVDYISFSFFPPVFNLADSFVCIGAILFVLYILIYKKD